MDIILDHFNFFVENYTDSLMISSIEFFHKYIWYLLFVTLSFPILYGLFIWRRKYLKAAYRRKKKAAMARADAVNIGAIFGMDVGGTLAKIVYFEANMPSENTSTSHDNDNNNNNTSSSPLSLSASSKRRPSLSASSNDLQKTFDMNNDASTDEKNKSIPRNRSFNFDEPDHQEALRKLYGEMNRNPLSAALGMGSYGSSALRDQGKSFYSEILGGRIHFLHFETKDFGTAIDLLSSTSLTENIATIGCTGGGAHKFAKQFEDQLDIKFVQNDELKSLVRGMHFALTDVADECYTYRPESDPTLASDLGNSNKNNDNNSNNKTNNAYTKEYNCKVQLPYYKVVTSETIPYLVVNIGSGVSILKVNSTTDYERVSGSSLGGGTYWGLCRLLTKCATYEDAIDIAEQGDSSEIDMLVRDIYGGGYDAMNLKGSMVASSFGKLVMKEKPASGLKEEDLAIGLLMMITNNIAQISYLNACLHKCSKIFFVGSFLRHNQVSCRRLAFAIDFWSKGQQEALFLEHDGYFGALGTFLESAFGKDVDVMLEQHFAAAFGSSTSNQESVPRDEDVSSTAKYQKNFNTFLASLSETPKEKGRYARKYRPGVIERSRRATYAWNPDSGSAGRKGSLSTPGGGIPKFAWENKYSNGNSSNMDETTDRSVSSSDAPSMSSSRSPTKRSTIGGNSTESTGWRGFGLKDRLVRAFSGKKNGNNYNDQQRLSNSSHTSHSKENGGSPLKTLNEDEEENDTGNASTSSRGHKPSSFMSMWRKPSTKEHYSNSNSGSNSSNNRPISGNVSDESDRNNSDSNHHTSNNNNNNGQEISNGHGNSFGYTIGSTSDRGSLSSVDDSDIPHNYGHSPGHKRHPSADIVMEALWDDDEDFFEEGDDPRRRSSTMA